MSIESDTNSDEEAKNIEANYKEFVIRLKDKELSEDEEKALRVEWIDNTIKNVEYQWENYLREDLLSQAAEDFLEGEKKLHVSRIIESGGGYKKRRRRIRTKQRKLSKKRKSKKKTKRRKTKRRRTRRR